MPRPDEPFVAWLGAGALPDVSVVGGKGASLARLAQLGFRVPPGFALTTTAFRAQLARVGVDGIERSPLDPEVGSRLAAAVDRLVGELVASGFDPRFAVRSSAIAEDGAATSYAGLHETELDVRPDGIDAAVRRCWASLWSPVAIAYRQRNGVDGADAAMAVVVQALVPADASAVVFTRHPVTGRDDQLVITSTRGLGDAMVSGTITPDTTVVDKRTRAVVEFDAGDGSDGPSGPALAPNVLADLVARSLDVEARFGVAVDIEAAHAGGVWYLLQARPITTGARVGAA
ncbi:MAG TPA: PEP/pyruvate-binding domain-containing protein [Candidatus Limnocylindrales bacterium]|nr:PEP/pyruvate-binding domain-containing protein [Candidatus Limnocylindrales bacterium]